MRAVILPLLPSGKCDHNGLDGVSSPVLVKLNWRGPTFITGAWGKDFALGTKLSNHYWVFPGRKGSQALEIFRLYSSYRKMLLYFPDLQFNLRGRNDKCENCAQGGGIIFYNGSFYYNCYNSRSLCKTDPHTMRVLRKELEGNDPSSFNNVYSYKAVKYQDMDLAGDEKGLWMVHGSDKGHGTMVIRKVDPNTLNVERPWTTTQRKTSVTNSFMICGVLYATQSVNETHEKIFYAFDTNKIEEHKINILMEKLLPTVQSLNYNPNDQKLYMYNDGYLVYYDLTFKTRAAVRKSRAAIEQGQDFKNEVGWSLVSKGTQDTIPVLSSSAIDQQQHVTSKGDINSDHEEGQTGGRKRGEIV